MNSVESEPGGVMPSYCGDAGHDCRPGERRERILLRPWLENLIHSGLIPGLEWIDAAKTMFKVPWKHRSKKNWSLRHSSVFLEWAKNTGRWKEGDPEPNYAQLKTRLRCAFNKAPDIDEIKELHCTKSEEPYKVYRFTERRDGKSRPLVRMFITRSSRSQAPRRRRRPKNSISGLPPSTGLSSIATTAGHYRVKDFKQEPSPTEVNGYYPVKIEPPVHIVPRTFPITQQYHELPATCQTLSVATEPCNGCDCRVTCTSSAARILPPSEVDCALSASKWSPPFPVCPGQTTLCMNLSSAYDPDDSSLKMMYTEAEMTAEHQWMDEAAEDYCMKTTECRDATQMSPDMNVASPTITSMSSSIPASTDRNSRPTVLPPLLDSKDECSSDEKPLLDAGADKLPACKEDDSAPPLVRFKNRYRRAQQLEEQQRLEHVTSEDWNHNEVTRICDVKTMNWLPGEELATVDEMYYRRSSTEEVIQSPERRKSGSEETRHCEKRAWTRVTPEVDVSDPWTMSSKVPCRGGTVVSRLKADDQSVCMKIDLQTQQKRETISSGVRHNYAVNCYEPKFNPDGRPDTNEASEMLYQETGPSSSSSAAAVALNLSHRVEDYASKMSSDLEAVDLRTKSSSDVSTSGLVERRSSEVESTYESMPVRDHQQDASNCGSDAVVDITHIEADFHRKSELIQTKTAVLNDKERELRMFEQRLAAREQAVSWQERQLQAMASTNCAARQSPRESQSYWEQMENVKEQKADNSQSRPTAQEPRTTTVYEPRQLVHLPDVGNRQPSSAWAMEKLEQQFARLAQGGTSDVSYQPADVSRTLQDMTEIQQRPKVIPVQNVDQYLNVSDPHNGPASKFSTAVRKRGRPKGSKNRCKMMALPGPGSAASGLPIREQWMNNLYRRAQMMHDSPPTSEPVPHNFAHQIMVQYRPPANSGVPPGKAAVLPGGQVLCSGPPRASNGGPPMSVTQPPVMHVTSLVGPAAESTAVSAVMPSRVQQLLVSAAFTTGASILPPLSPTPTAEFKTPVADPAWRVPIPQEQFQYERNVQVHGGQRNGEYRRGRIDGSSIPSDPHVSAHSGRSCDPNYSQAGFGNGSVRRHDVPRDHLHDPVLSNGTGRSNCNPVAGRCRWENERNYILPTVSSYGAERQWSMTRAEPVHHQDGTVYTRTSPLRDEDNVDDDDDDDTDNRLVVVID